MSAQPHISAIVKMVGQFHRHDKWRVFSDFAETAAISISNAIDLIEHENREQRFNEIAKGYSKEEFGLFADMLGELVLALEVAPRDVLGEIFHELELHNQYKGQFFTPYCMCKMMAEMTATDLIEAAIEKHGFATASEPACGAGAMVIALADSLRCRGINYQQHLHVTAVDVDIKCVHMAYLQFSLLHIPAVVVHGDTLRMEEYSHWRTPAHVMGGWQFKLRMRQESMPSKTEEPEAIILPPAPQNQLSLFNL